MNTRSAISMVQSVESQVLCDLSVVWGIYFVKIKMTHKDPCLRFMFLFYGGVKESRAMIFMRQMCSVTR